MSRVGKNPVVIPDGIDLNIVDQIVSAKGKVGELSVSLPREVEVTREENMIWIKTKSDSKRSRAMW